MLLAGSVPAQSAGAISGLSSVWRTGSSLCIIWELKSVNKLTKPSAHTPPRI
jgi:hypothetical protein